jgi:hypothetical protein
MTIELRLPLARGAVPHLPLGIGAADDVIVEGHGSLEQNQASSVPVAVARARQVVITSLAGLRSSAVSMRLLDRCSVAKR